MDPSIPKAEKRLKFLSEKVGASDEGVLWLKETLDPFSDTPRRPVGFPDLITGNSVMQVVKQSYTFTVGSEAQDVHVFLDTIDTDIQLVPAQYLGGAQYAQFGESIVTTSANNASAVHRGGIVIRADSVGNDLLLENTVHNIPLPSVYTESGTTRIIAKAFEVHNTTNKLQVGGAVTVYRDTGPVPHSNSEARTLWTNGIVTPPQLQITHQGHPLSKVPTNLAMVTNIPGSQQWDAEDGCYVVATMASQTNNPTDERDFLIIDKEDTSPTVVWVNAIDGVSTAPTTPPRLITSEDFMGNLTSPFFLCGAYFTGLPAGSKLTINVLFLVERFVNASNLDLVVLAQPSPFYDPVAMELYSKTAMRLPHGVKVCNNADGDWIKSVADVLSTFGVPGMPIVKGAVDVYNTFSGSKKDTRKEEDAKDRRIRELEERLNRMNGAQMIPRGVVVESKPKPKPKPVPVATKAPALSVKPTGKSSPKSPQPRNPTMLMTRSSPKVVTKKH